MIESRKKELYRTYGLLPALIQRIQVAAIQSMALYVAYIWWKNQKTDQNRLQKLIHKQTCLMTGIYFDTTIAAVISESGLISAHIMLDFLQRIYTYQLFNLSDSILNKDILPITLQIGDKNAQTKDQPVLYSIWASNKQVTTYS